MNFIVQLASVASASAGGVACVLRLNDGNQQKQKQKSVYEDDKLTQEVSALLADDTVDQSVKNTLQKLLMSNLTLSKDISSAKEENAKLRTQKAELQIQSEEYKQDVRNLLTKQADLIQCAQDLREHNKKLIDQVDNVREGAKKAAQEAAGELDRLKNSVQDIMQKYVEKQATLEDLKSEMEVMGVDLQIDEAVQERIEQAQQQSRGISPTIELQVDSSWTHGFRYSLDKQAIAQLNAAQQRSLLDSKSFATELTQSVTVGSAKLSPFSKKPNFPPSQHNLLPNITQNLLQGLPRAQSSQMAAESIASGGAVADAEESRIEIGQMTTSKLHIQKRTNMRKASDSARSVMVSDIAEQLATLRLTHSKNAQQQLDPCPEPSNIILSTTAKRPSLKAFALPSEPSIDFSYNDLTWQQ